MREIAALVTRLLSHYWTAADREETRVAQIEDWLDDLREFGSEIVDEACTSWRRGQKHRPTPADIRKLAIEEQRARLERGRSQLKRLDGPVDLDAWARSLGWSSYLERQDAIAANEQRYERGLAWQREHAAERAARPMAQTTARAAAKAFGLSAKEIPSPEEDRRERARQREQTINPGDDHAEDI